ncbi:MAG TPA: hypothetical protein VEV62_12510 [Parafilimonas sp.]|nr:hypothetical protein [Parafilimonas sp.]
MNRFWKAVLLTTIVAGTLDIIAAHVDQTIRTGRFPDKMFYAIAGGAIGLQRAFTSGKEVLLLGIFIHYFIAFCFTLFYFVIYPAVKKVLPNKFVNGFLYALFVQAVMTFIVLPLTAFPKRPFVFTIDVVIGLLVLTVVFGLPISIMTENYYRKKAIIGSDK